MVGLVRGDCGGDCRENGVGGWVYRAQQQRFEREQLTGVPITQPDQVFQIMIEKRTPTAPDSIYNDHSNFIGKPMRVFENIRNIPPLKIVIIYRSFRGQDFDTGALEYIGLCRRLIAQVSSLAGQLASPPAWRQMELEIRAQGKMRKWGIVRDGVSGGGIWRTDEFTTAKIEEEEPPLLK